MKLIGREIQSSCFRLINTVYDDFFCVLHILLIASKLSYKFQSISGVFCVVQTDFQFDFSNIRLLFNKTKSLVDCMKLDSFQLIKEMSGKEMVRVMP